MLKQMSLFAVLMAASAFAALAQTTVTNTNNGTTNVIPKYNGTASLTNSAITDSSGNIGIGTGTPDGKLEVNGDSDLLGYAAYNHKIFGNGDSTHYYIGHYAVGGSDGLDLHWYGGVRLSDNGGAILQAGSGKVGIGTTAPNELLEIGSTGSNGGRMFVSNGGGASRKGLLFTSPTPTVAYSRIESFDYGAFAPIPLVINSSLGGGNVGIGTTSPGSKLEVNGGIKLSAGSGGAIVFADGTSQNTAFPTTIAGGIASYTGGLNVTGNAGIGTTSPAAKLDVASSAATVPLIRSYGNTFSGVRLDTSSANANARNWGIVSNYGAYGDFGIVQSNTIGGDFTVAGATRLYINPSGNVGIGTGTPMGQGGGNGLEVSGNGANTILRLSDSINNSYMLGLSTSVSGYSTIQSEHAGVAYTTLNLNPHGGNVGVGTATPSEKLEVSGRIKVSGAGQIVFAADNSVQSTAWTGTLTGGDYAESVDVTGDRTNYEPGDVLVIDPDHSGRFLKATERYSLSVTGVYSTRPGVVGRRQKIDKALATTEVPMAMVGIVPIKVSAENGPIHRGDVLVTSSTPGYAMKGTDRSLLAGAVIGKALEPLNSDAGLIEAVISLQ